MTDLAILSLSGAGVTVLSVVSLLVMSMRAHDSEKRAGAAELRASLAEAGEKRWKETADAQTKRADALDLEIDDIVESIPDDVSRARMHAKWVARRKARDTGTGAPGVPVEPAPAEHSPGPDDLLKPGE